MSADPAPGPVDVVGVGEAMVLLQTPPGARLSTAASADILVAGAEFNVCAAVARLGGVAVFASAVGDDPFGRRVLGDARAHGIRTDLVSVDPGRPTGVFFKEIRADGARRVYYYYRRGSAAAAMDETAAPRILAVRPRAIVVSGLTAALGAGPARLVAALCAGTARAGAMLVLDPNLRPALGDPADVVATLRPLLRHVDLLVLGRDESGALLDATAPDAAFAAARTAGVAEVVLKGGPDGLWYAGPDGRPRHLPSAAVRVRDPVGAGDALRAATSPHGWPEPAAPPRPGSGPSWPGGPWRRPGTPPACPTRRKGRPCSPPPSTPRPRRRRRVSRRGRPRR